MPIFSRLLVQQQILVGDDNQKGKDKSRSKAKVKTNADLATASRDETARLRSR